MLEVSLDRLWREGEARVDGQIAADDPMWEGFDLEWTGPVAVHLRAAPAGSGEVVVRGTVSGVLRRECRRCLAAVEADLDEEVTMVFADEPEDGAAGEDDVRSLPRTGGALDLREALREEVLLAIDPYVICDAECRGLCPRCGKDLNEGPCDCADDEPDPRWDALRSLKDE